MFLEKVMAAVQSFGLRWDDVKNLGRIHSEELPSGAARHRIVFHIKGRRVTVSRQTHENGVEAPFPSGKCGGMR